MITRVSLSKGKAARFLGNLGKAIIQATLALPLILFLTYLYSPNGLFNLPSLILAMFQVLILVEIVPPASSIFIYEKAISYFEEDSAKINEKINALGTRVNPEPNGKGEESSIRRGIEVEIRYLSSQLLEKRKTIARVRRDVNRLYPSKKMSRAGRLALFLVLPIFLLAVSLPFNFLVGPPFTSSAGAVVIGTFLGLFLLFVRLKKEKMFSRIRRCGAIVGATKTIEKRKNAMKKQQQRTK